MIYKPTRAPSVREMDFNINYAEQMHQAMLTGFSWTHGHVSRPIYKYLLELSMIGCFCGVENLYPDKAWLWYLGVDYPDQSTIILKQHGGAGSGKYHLVVGCLNDVILNYRKG